MKTPSQRLACAAMLGNRPTAAPPDCTAKPSPETVYRVGRNPRFDACACAEAMAARACAKSAVWELRRGMPHEPRKAVEVGVVAGNRRDAKVSHRVGVDEDQGAGWNVGERHGDS